MTDHVTITKTETFRPRFDDLSKDYDRLSEHIWDLYHQDRLGKTVDGVRALIGPANDQLREAYYARELYAQIEASWGFLGEIYGATTHDDFHDTIDRLIALGQGPRAIRIWRKRLAAVRATYWRMIDARRRGHKDFSNCTASVNADLRKDHTRYVERILEYQGAYRILTEMAHHAFRRAGASDMQLARLRAEAAEIEAEERAKPDGKPDPRPMDEDLFWELIGRPDEDGTDAVIHALPDRLSLFKPTAIKAFDTLLHEMDAKAYRNDIWALAYLVNGGCSDDDFAAFKCWLILQGRELFEAVLADPDAVDVSRFGESFGDCWMLLDTPLLAHEIKTGKEMTRKKRAAPVLGGPDIVEADFATALPRIAKAVGA